MKKINSTKKKLPPEQCEELLKILKARFEKNTNRHKGIEWAKVQTKLKANPSKLWSLNEMERTGGEPDVVVPIAIGNDKKTGEFIFYDCSTESPKGRRSICYDLEALEARKENKPAGKRCEYGYGNGDRTPDRRTILRTAETWKLRYKNIKLVEDATGNPETGRRHLR